MWECLVTLSTWTESNSGQIQILIAFGAIGLAFSGYKKVLEQINISQIQTEFSSNQQTLELKLYALNLIAQSVESNCKILSQIPILINELDMIYQELLKRADPEAVRVDEMIKKIKNQRIKVEMSKNELVEISRKISSISYTKSDDLKDYIDTLYKVLIESIDVSNDFNMLPHNFANIRREKNIL